MQASVKIPKLGQINPNPFDFDSWQVPHPPHPKCVLECHLDLEGSGVPGQACGVCAIGMFFCYLDGSGERVNVLGYEVAVESLYDHPHQLKNFWLNPELNNASAWQRIVDARRPAAEVSLEISRIIAMFSTAGWTVHLFARPVGYDFREFSNFFTTQGLMAFKKEIIDTGGMEKFNSRSLRETYESIIIGHPCPFGFGGAGDVTDINQQMRGWCRILGIPPVDFKIPMKNVLGRSCLAHGGLQDAIDQAQTYHTVLKIVRYYTEALESMVSAAKLLGPDNVKEFQGTVERFEMIRNECISFFK